MAATECYERIAYDLGELHKKLKRVQSQMLEEYHVSLMEYHILGIMLRLREASQSELASALDVDKALISRQIQSLVKKDLLSCSLNPDCRRKNTLTLSENALALIPKLEDVHRRSLERLFSDLDDKQLFDFRFILEGLVSKI